MPKKKKSTEIDVEEVLKEFREYEESSGRRKGTFKIDAPFDEALKKILKAKPKAKRPHDSTKRD